MAVFLCDVGVPVVIVVADEMDLLLHGLVAPEFLQLAFAFGLVFVQYLEVSDPELLLLRVLY